MPKVPDPILHSIRCVHCKHWLSCGPVILQPNGGSVCGRCETYREGPRDQYRHFAYEVLACYFKFPCKNYEKNCPELLPYKKVIAHETKCTYGSTCSTLFSHPSAVFKSKKQLDIRAAIKLEIIPDEVLEYLRCGNCAGYLSCSPVYVCRDGTSICHRCTSQLKQPSPEFVRDSSFELFVDMMIFPCIYRYRGCSHYFKFGEQSYGHETECFYGKPYSRENRLSKQQEALTKRRESNNRHFKERDVAETHAGHIYATLVPNAPVFARPSKQEIDVFVDEFLQHRENLANKWGRTIDVQPQVFNNPETRHLNRASSYPPVDSIPRPSLQLNRHESMYDNMGYGNGLINELKLKQNIRKSARIEDHPETNNNFSNYYESNEKRMYS